MFVRFAAKTFTPGREPLIISIIVSNKKETCLARDFIFNKGEALELDDIEQEANRMSRPGDGGDILRRKPAIESVGGFVHMRLSLTTTTYFVRPSIDVQWTRDVGLWGCGVVGL